MSPYPAGYTQMSSSTPVDPPLLPLGAVPSPRSRSRVVLIVSPDAIVRERLRKLLTGLRWQVLEAPGGAEAWVVATSAAQLEAVLIDPWLPDLEVSEFMGDFSLAHASVDMLMTDGTVVPGKMRGPYRHELLYALHHGQDADSASWQSAPDLGDSPIPPTLGTYGTSANSLPPNRLAESLMSSADSSAVGAEGARAQTAPIATPMSPLLPENFRETVGVRNPSQTVSMPAPKEASSAARRETAPVDRIPELIGRSPQMLEVSRRIRLVAARPTPVLIEGPTGSGKELVADALHRFSQRSRKPFVAINCAAIPEALLEAELFGHTRGAFTGAVQGRIGRIESADGGTLFLDEIGEMPLALQSKLLRFFESGELQRIGDNETVKVDVRIVAATHQPLYADAQKGHFRADLYYRLAVFLIRTPPLLDHMEDLPDLVAHFLERMGRKSPVKRMDSSALVRLTGHSWPGNVRELEHVLERAAILAGESPMISESEIDFGVSLLN